MVHMEKKIKSYKDLRIWVKGIEIVKNVYAITEKYPSKEIYGLVSQMRRAAVSIPSNIAEGFKRQHNKEYKQFLHASLGSAAELETQIIISKDLGYVAEQDFKVIAEMLDHLSRMITVLTQRL